ncbi:hypothetical protein EDD18DRAFT_1107917 [Armillaria luteobubalina]|uniref:Heterokaryon incompatibility domain-containing protein n=1 Tax=Armillaria luteobubalina TaxID=153913 RepID=A0AA39PZY0_9AGAR|nr:hypothetical protein EDD18DRAFT_1107917 [Armillaria luteobubalina]
MSVEYGPGDAVCTPHRESYFTFSPYVDLSINSLERTSSKGHGNLQHYWKFTFDSLQADLNRPKHSAVVSDQNTNITMALKRKIEHVDVESNDLEDRYRPRHNRYQQDEFALSAFTETGRAEVSIEVPKQRSYRQRWYTDPVIPRSLADTPCATLGVQGVLDRLNATLRTSYTLPTAPSSSASAASAAPSSATSVQDQLSLLAILKDCIQKNYDFGLAYALLRPVWNTVNPSKIHDELSRREEADRKRRQNALVGNRIVEPDLKPRRVWDLCSNRVVPYWITSDSIFYTPTPISHAWVDEKDRVDVWIPINGNRWPVPIPKDADLNLIRIEMLNLAAEMVERYKTLCDDEVQYMAEYVWLDVLCLRQKEEGGPREDLRMWEWRLDVPTIGAVYRTLSAKVMIYLNGLGRPLQLKDGDLDSDRSWFRRAWTLQEAGSQRIIAGDTPDGPMHAQRICGGKYETALLTRFHKELNSVKSMKDDLSTTITHMRKRVSTNPVDRVAGLAFPLLPHTIPAYHESETLEDAWTALVNAMSCWTREAFLFMYPGVGLGCKKWRPTWDQLMKEPLLPYRYSEHAGVEHNYDFDQDWYFGCCILKGYVWGLDTGSTENHDRYGELVIKDAEEIAHTFKIHITHRLPIPEDTYTLLDGGHSHWAVGRQLPNQRFEKVSVITIVYSLYWDLDELAKFAEQCRFVLV